MLTFPMVTWRVVNRFWPPLEPTLDSFGHGHACLTRWEKDNDSFEG